jgi:hypothetical protein
MYHVVLRVDAAAVANSGCNYTVEPGQAPGVRTFAKESLRLCPAPAPAARNQGQLCSECLLQRCMICVFLLQCLRAASISCDPGALSTAV